MLPAALWGIYLWYIALNHRRIIFGTWQNIYYVNTLLNISEYAFKNRSNTDCDPRGDEYNSLNVAKKECKYNKRCQGVIIGNFNDAKRYNLCPTNATTIFGIEIDAILSEKIIIGKVFSN